MNKKLQSQWLTMPVSCSCHMLAATDQLRVSSPCPVIQVSKWKEQLPCGICFYHGREKSKRVSRNTQWLLKVLLKHDNHPICSHTIDQSKSHDQTQCQKSRGAYSSWRNTNCKSQEVWLFGNRSLATTMLHLAFKSNLSNHSQYGL